MLSRALPQGELLLDSVTQQPRLHSPHRTHLEEQAPEARATASSAPAGVCVRWMKLPDLNAAKAVDDACFPPEYEMDLEDYEFCIFHEDCGAIVAEEVDSARVVGLALYHLQLGTIYLRNLAVAPSDQGRGVGGALLQAVLAAGRAKGAERAQLHVAVFNARAQRLYHRFGFAHESVAEGFYPEGDGLVLGMGLGHILPRPQRPLL
mmetsp:Transcript_4585/g.10788  ORF Transcript_4585/g.10788 Transcript_4585/m.10788 type:complete len:206 (-) Transcript_4585:101-718(-)